MDQPEFDYSKPPSADDKPFIPKAPDPTAAQAAGSPELPDDTWYNLEFEYQNKRSGPTAGSAYFVGENASWSFWDYMSATHSNGPRAMFKKVSSDGDWMYLDMQDGNHLSFRAPPRLWLYRSSAYPVGWKIVNGQLFGGGYDTPVGAVHNSFLVPDAYYLCIGGQPLKNCRWVKAPDR